MTGELPEFEEKSPQIALEELGKLKNELESGEFKLGEFLYEVEHEIHVDVIENLDLLDPFIVKQKLRSLDEFFSFR